MRKMDRFPIVDRTSVMTCGDCSGLNREALCDSQSKPCRDRGKSEADKICPSFRPSMLDLASSVKSDGTALSAIADVVQHLSPSSIKLLTNALLQESVTRRHGAYFYMPVYVRYRGTEKSDYLSNFMSARVLSCDSKHIQLVSDDGKITLQYENTGFSGPAVYSEAEFAKLRDQLVVRNRLKDPDMTRRTVRKFIPDDFDGRDISQPKRKLDGMTVYSMDEVSRVNKFNKKGGKKKQQRESLVDFAQQLERGYLRPTKSRKKDDGLISTHELSDL